MIEFEKAGIKTNQYHRVVRNVRWVILVSVATVILSTSGYARIGVILMESMPGTAGYVSQGGHSAIYLSETCTDNFVKLRPCTSNDPVWGVIAERTASFSSKAKYDWLAFPVAMSLYASNSTNKAPLIVNDHLRKKLIEKFYFENSGFRKMVVNSDPEFENGMKLSNGYKIPRGRWQNFFGSQLRRSLFVVWINDNSGAKERELVEAINGFSNRPKYNTLMFLFAGNCSKWVQGSLRQIDALKDAGFGQNWSGDGFLISPKGVTEEAFNAAKRIMAKDPNVFVTVEYLPQVPGTYTRSYEPLFIIESAFKNQLVFPVIAFFHPMVFLIGRVYFKLIKRFSIQSKYRSYFNLESARLSIKRENSSKDKSAARNRMKELRNSFFGSKVWWEQKKIRFQKILLLATSAGLIRKAKDVKKGRLLKRLLDDNSDLEIDSAGNPWLVRRDEKGGLRKAGLTLKTVDQGDRRLGFAILLARIGWQLNQKKFDRRITKEKFQLEWDKLMEFAQMYEIDRLAKGR